jgi:FkbH-like protein
VNAASSLQTDPIALGESLLRGRKYREAAACFSSVVEQMETLPPDLAVKLARCYQSIGDSERALRSAIAAVESDDYASWHGAAQIARAAVASAPQGVVRETCRTVLIGSYTTASWTPLLQLAALRFGVRLEIVHECAYGQYRQEILDPQSALFAAEPELVVIALHEGELHFNGDSDPQEAVSAELQTWTQLWDALAQRTAARVVLHNFAAPADSPLGHLTTRTRNSRVVMVQELNRRFAEHIGDRGSIVDCERLSSIAGKRRWFDARYWHLSKQAVSPECQPLLARHTAAVVAATLGLGRKCIVLDLDNTLWGGVIGEDGWTGIRLGDGAEGEAFIAFQEYLLALKRRGILLAVCSKNNDADARETFLHHPAMRLRLEDFALFVANWRPKAENLREIAETLGIGLSSLVFVDDNPAERQAVRRALPEVDVPVLPRHPAEFVRALSDALSLETVAITAEDLRRTDLYRAKTAAKVAQSEAPTLDAYYRSLRMQATISPFTAADLPRIAQLVGKTNQFNLTTRRHSLSTLAGFMESSRCLHLSLRLRDCFDDHGLVGVLIALQEGEVLDIDTFLLSCRVIGRTAEHAMMAALCGLARERGCSELHGVYIRSAKNAQVTELYPRLGFEPASGDGSRWRYNLTAKGPITNEFIEIVDKGGR